MADQDIVTVKNQLGQLGTLPRGALPGALKQGYTIPSNDEIDAHNTQLQYGSGIANPAIAFLESAADTSSFGASRWIENKTGITTPEAQAARAKYNPVAHLAGIPAGLLADPIGAIGATTRLGGKAAEAATKVIGKAPEGASFLARAVRNVPAAAVAGAVEGGVFGAGNAVSEANMGDPDLNAEKLMTNIGYGGLYGGAIGGLLEGGANVFKKSILKDHSAMDAYRGDIEQGANQAKSALDDQQAAAQASQNLNPDINPEIQGIAQAPFKEFPKSLEEIQQAVKTNFPVVPEGLPSYSRSSFS